jgi:hypothetical protein
MFAARNIVGRRSCGVGTILSSIQRHRRAIELEKFLAEVDPRSAPWARGWDEDPKPWTKPAEPILGSSDDF